VTIPHPPAASQQVRQFVDAVNQDLAEFREALASGIRHLSATLPPDEKRELPLFIKEHNVKAEKVVAGAVGEYARQHGVGEDGVAVLRLEDVEGRLVRFCLSLKGEEPGRAGGRSEEWGTIPW
jgi:hypothetical protein